MLDANIESPLAIAEADSLASLFAPPTAPAQAFTRTAPPHTLEALDISDSSDEGSPHQAQRQSSGADEAQKGRSIAGGDDRSYSYWIRQSRPCQQEDAQV